MARAEKQPLGKSRQRSSAPGQSRSAIAKIKPEDMHSAIGGATNRDDAQSLVGKSLVSGEIVMADMTFFVVSEERLDHLTEQNDDASAYQAFAAALASFGGGIIVAAIYADHLSSFAQVATFMLAPLCIIGAAFCFFRGRSHQRSAGGELTRIKANRARVNFKSYVEQDTAADH